MSENEIKNNGQFQQGNTIGEETRFKRNNKAANKYRDEYCDMLLSYFIVKEREVIYEETYYKDGTLKSKTPKFILPQDLPTFELFAAKIGVTTKTLKNWADKYPRFSDAYERAKCIQLGIAKNNGITKQYDSNFAKFILINDHDMTDRTVQEQTQEKPFEVNIHVIRKQ